MKEHWAVEHLAVIRTLMERTAVYRRALVPTSLWAAVVGLAGGALGWFHRIVSPTAFLAFWCALGLLTLAGALLLMRREALRDREPFWSPAARRVTAAMAPCLVAGFACGMALGLADADPEAATVRTAGLWMAFYGCALHAAGFFMPRGIRVLGWGFVVGGGVVAAFGMPLASWSGLADHGACAHLWMGASFGGIHGAYGLYLRVTGISDESP